jgi:hypothetical protein
MHKAYEPLTRGESPGFFTVHIDCRTTMRWSIEQQS